MTKQLLPEEWGAFNEICLREFGERAPTPQEATVIVEKCGEEIVGCMAVTWVPVVSSVWVKESKRGGIGLLHSLVSFAFDLFPSVKTAITFTKNEKLARFHRMMGLKDEGFVSSWRRE